MTVSLVQDFQMQSNLTEIDSFESFTIFLRESSKFALEFKALLLN